MGDHAVLVPVRSLAAYRALRIAERLARRAERAGRPHRDPRRLPVTMLLYCPRMQYLRAKKPRMTTGGLLAAEMGRAVHRLVEDAAREDGAETEVHVAARCGDVEVTGRADIVYSDHVVEVKTVPEAPPEPELLEEHSIQAWWYAENLGRSGAELLYVSRTDGGLYPVPAERPTGGASRRICERARLLSRALVEEKEPGCIRGPWCGWCPYRYGCPCWP